jgi:dUTP pyrophosphatase
MRRLRSGTGLIVPAKATPGSSGFDLSSAIDAELEPMERRLFPTGFAIEIPIGFEGQIRSRSGLARDHGVVVANSPGTIDSDYRGEIGVLLINLGSQVHQIRHGMRIAQLVLCPVSLEVIELVAELGATTRGSNGFGHSGVGQLWPNQEG